MLSSVFLSGRLGDIFDEKTRIVEIDRVIPGASGKFIVDRILVRTMLGKESEFMTSPNGYWIVSKGRLETVDGRLIVISEIDEILQAEPS